jgi:ribosomal protein L37AE/L43A
MSLSDKIAQKLHKMTSPKGKIKKDGSLESDEDDISVGSAMAEMASCGNTRGKSRTASLSKKEQKLSGEKTNKGEKTDQRIDVDERDKMTCHTCKVSGHKYLAECELCDFWFCAKCQHLKSDAMKLLALYRNIHCEQQAVGLITNAKYSLGKRTPEKFLNERIIMEIDQAMKTLHEKVKKAETDIKTSYADIVKSFDAKLQVMADSRPIGAPGQATYPDQNLKELQERQER